MARLIHFLRDFDFTPQDDPYITIAYKAGMCLEVAEECEFRAISCGAANYSDILEDDLIDGPFEDDY